jgi:hypothetical protein
VFASIMPPKPPNLGNEGRGREKKGGKTQ